MEEINRLKQMLEGKAPIDHALAASVVPGEPSTIIQERIIYKEGENKENNTELEE